MVESLPACFDHLVVVAPTLAMGVAWTRERLGVTVPPGGAHPMMGTHNHLMRLGPSSFFEIIAIDPAAPSPGRARWFGMDHAGAEPRLVTWVVAVPDVEAARAASPIDPGPPVRVTRGALSWLLTIPEDGALVEGGTMPSLIQWPKPHPAAAMPDRGLQLVSLEITHPKPDQLRSALSAIGLSARFIEVSAGDHSLAATFTAPGGVTRHLRPARAGNAPAPSAQ